MTYLPNNRKIKDSISVSLTVDEVPGVEFEVFYDYTIVEEATVLNPPDKAYPGSRSVETEITGVVLYNFKTDKGTDALPLFLFKDMLVGYFEKAVEEHANNL